MVSWETPQCVTSAVAPVARVSWPTFSFHSLLTHLWCPEKSWVQFHILLLITHAPRHTKSTPLHVSRRYQIHIGSESKADMVRHLSLFCICSKFLSNWCGRLIQKLVNWVIAESHSHSKSTYKPPCEQSRLNTVRSRHPPSREWGGRSVIQTKLWCQAVLTCTVGRWHQPRDLELVIYLHVDAIICKVRLVPSWVYYREHYMKS